MSQIAGSYSCTGCDYSGLEAHRPILVCYQLGSGLWFEGVPATGWCPDCDGIVDLERIETLEAIHRRVEQDAEAGLPRWLLQAWISTLARWRATEPRTWEAPGSTEAELRAAWRSQRVSPPRCLACGGKRATPVLWVKVPGEAASPVGGERHRCFARHHCVGDLLLSYPGPERGVHYSLRPLRLVVSPEGALLRTEGLD